MNGYAQHCQVDLRHRGHQADTGTQGMTALAPRLRMFAGPNGSGKSTIKDMLPTEWLGVYINVARVQSRVVMGGHPVAEDKIRSRYVRSLELLSEAVSYVNRAYIFDNSGAEEVWIAEVGDGTEMEMKTDQMPAWFKAALWDKFE